MRIRSYAHALDLIARTMLPWAMRSDGRIRVDAANEGWQPLAYCPLCALAQSSDPEGLCPSGIFPDTAFAWSGHAASEGLMQRIVAAADNLSHARPSDRAQLLAACGLA